MAAYEADKVVVSLIADNAQFDSANKASAQQFQQGMSAVQSSGKQAEGAVSQFSSALKSSRLEMNQSRIGMLEFQHISRGMSDQFAASGLSTQLFTSHIGELSEAVILSGGALGSVGAFLQGPWGMALTLATTALITLIATHKQHAETLDDAVKKLQQHHDKTELSDQADRAWINTVDGLIDRSKALNEQLDKRLETQTQIQQATMREAQADIAAARAKDARLETTPGTTQKQIDDANAAITAANVALHKVQVIAGQETGEAAAEIDKAAQRFADEQLAVIHSVQGVHPELAEKGVSDQLSASYYKIADAVKAAAAAGVDFTATQKQVNALDQQLFQGTVTVKTYTTEIAKLANSLNDAAEQAKELNKNPVQAFKAGLIGAEGTGKNQMGSSAAGFGQFMPSTWLSYFNKIFPQDQGLSDTQKLGLRNNKEVASAIIDKATDDYISVLESAGQKITAASLYTVHLLGSGDAKKLFAAAPGTQTSSFLSAAVLKGNPFLRGTAAQAQTAIAGRIGGSSGAVSSGAAAVDQALKQQAQKEAEQQAAYTGEIDRLNQEYLSARKSQIKDELTQLDIAEDETKAEQQKRDDSYKSAVATGKLTQAQADQLTAMSATVAAEKIKALETQKQAEIDKRIHDASDQDYQFQIDGLKAQEELATSQHQRRELDLAILDILYDQKAADLEYLKLQAERNGNLDQANLYQKQIDQLPAQKQADFSKTIQGTMDPLQSWLHSVPHDAKEVTEALQGIAVNGFDDIASSIAGVVKGTQSLGSAFSSVAKSIVGDLVQMTVKMLIFRALSSVLGGGSSSFANPIVDLGSPISLGGNAASGLESSFAGTTVPQLARGGMGTIGGVGGTDNNLLSLNGQPIAWVSKGEGLAVTPTNGTAAPAYSAAGQAMVVVHVEANDYFDARVAQVTDPRIASASVRAAQGGAALARDSLARQQLHRL